MQIQYNRNTAATYVERLEKKGYITTKHVGRKRIIQPKLSLVQMIEAQIDMLAEEYYDGNMEAVRLEIEGIFNQMKSDT